MSVTINQGTQTAIKTTSDSGEIQHVRNDGGTITALGNGTITNGTVITQGLRHADEFATVVTTGTSTLGTIVAGVSGSAIYVTDLTISVGSATNVEIASGGTSTRIYGTLYFNPNGGIAKTFTTPIRTASGSALVFKQSAAISPMSISCSGYVD